MKTSRAALLACFVLGCSSDPAPSTGGANAEAAKGDKAGEAAAPEASDGPEAAPTAAEASADPSVAATKDAETTGEAEPLPPAGPPVDLAALPEVGVEFCDAYVAKYRTCIETKVPEDERATHAAKLADEVSHWTRTAKGAGPNAGPALEIGCKSAQAAAARSTRDLDCEW